MIRKFVEQTQPHAMRAMETETIQKNGASPKSHTSRGKFSNFIRKLFFILLLLILFNACDKEDVNIENVGLSEEELTEFYSKTEDFINSPDFQSYNTIDELKSAIEKWLRQQSEIESIKIDENILIVYFKGKGTCEIEFVEQIENTGLEDTVFEYEPDTVDDSYFAISTLQNMILKGQASIKPQSVTRTAITNNANSPTYISPIFWEPHSDDKPAIMPEYEKLPPFSKIPSRIFRDTLCDPLALPSFLQTPVEERGPKPNLIFISTHGGTDSSLNIGCCANFDRYIEIREGLKRKGITIPSNPILKIIEKQNRYVINLKSNDLQKLLNGVNINNSIVFLMACHSMESDALYSVFKNIGAEYVYGFSDTQLNRNLRGVIQGVMFWLLLPTKNIRPWGDVMTTGETFQYMRMYHANISGSELLVGKGNGDFKFNYPPVTISNRQSRSKIMRSSTLQEEGVVMFGCHVNYYSLSTGYSDSYCGLVYSSQTDDPKIGDGKSKIKFEKLDHEISNGEDFYFSFNDIEHNKQYYYRAFVRSEYSVYYSKEVEPFMIEGEEWVEVNGVKWATRNVGGPGMFVNSPQDYGGYYLWSEAQNICPAGWRLPSHSDVVALHAAQRSEDISEKIFFPNAGLLNDGNPYNVGIVGTYWDSYSYTGEDGNLWCEIFNPNIHPDSNSRIGWDRPEWKMSRSVRCVKE
jgi:uncharacterized protein (TIGR02145 family)